MSRQAQKYAWDKWAEVEDSRFPLYASRFTHQLPVSRRSNPVENVLYISLNL
jgi:hypothetical protein